jgi:hypothetical protein
MAHWIEKLQLGQGPIMNAGENITIRNTSPTLPPLDYSTINKPAELATHLATVARILGTANTPGTVGRVFHPSPNAARHLPYSHLDAHLKQFSTFSVYSGDARPARLLPPFQSSKASISSPPPRDRSAAAKEGAERSPLIEELPQQIPITLDDGTVIGARQTASIRSSCLLRLQDMYRRYPLTRAALFGSPAGDMLGPDMGALDPIVLSEVAQAIEREVALAEHIISSLRLTVTKRPDARWAEMLLVDLSDADLSDLVTDEVREALGGLDAVFQLVPAGQLIATALIGAWGQGTPSPSQGVPDKLRRCLFFTTPGALDAPYAHIYIKKIMNRSLASGATLDHDAATRMLLLALADAGAANLGCGNLTKVQNKWDEIIGDWREASIAYDQGVKRYSLDDLLTLQRDLAELARLQEAQTRIDLMWRGGHGAAPPQVNHVSSRAKPGTPPLAEGYFTAEEEGDDDEPPFEVHSTQRDRPRRPDQAPSSRPDARPRPQAATPQPVSRGSARAPDARPAIPTEPAARPRQDPAARLRREPTRQSPPSSAPQAAQPRPQRAAPEVGPRLICGCSDADPRSPHLTCRCGLLSRHTWLCPNNHPNVAAHRYCQQSGPAKSNCPYVRDDGGPFDLSNPAHAALAPQLLEHCKPRRQQRGYRVHCARTRTDGDPYVTPPWVLSARAARPTSEWTVIPENSQWLISTAAIETNGRRVFLSGDDSYLLDSELHAYRLLRRDGYTIVSGYAPCPGRFIYGPRPEGSSAPVVHLHLDTAAQINVAGDGWEACLKDQAPSRLKVLGVGAKLCTSKARGSLVLEFPPAAATIPANTLSPLSLVSLLCGFSLEAGAPVSVKAVRADQGTAKQSRFAALRGKELITNLNLTDPRTINRYHTLVRGACEFKLPRNNSHLDEPHHETSSRRRAVPSEKAESDPDPGVLRGTVWYVDIAANRDEKTGVVTYAAIFSEQGTTYVRTYIMRDKSATSFIAAVEAHRHWVRTHMTTPDGRPLEFRELRGDCDSSWTTTADGTVQPTAEFLEYLRKQPVKEWHSAPETQAHNFAEQVMLKLKQFVREDLNRAHLSDYLWEHALLAATAQLNLHPMPGSRFKDRRDNTRHANLFGRRPDVSTYIAHFGQAVYIHQGKGQNAHPGLFLMPSEDSSGWVVFDLVKMKRVTSYHVSVVKGNLFHVRVLESDLLRSAGTAFEDRHHDELRRLFAAPNSPERDQHLVLLDPLSNTVVRLEPSGANTGAPITAVEETPAPAAIAVSAPPTPAPDPPAPRHPAPSAILKLPGATAISFVPNGKRPNTASGKRYAKYSKVKTVGDLKKLQERRFLCKDLSWDLKHGLVTVPDLPQAMHARAVAVGQSAEAPTRSMPDIRARRSHRRKSRPTPDKGLDLLARMIGLEKLEEPNRPAEAASISPPHSPSPEEGNGLSEWLDVMGVSLPEDWFAEHAPPSDPDVPSVNVATTAHSPPSQPKPIRSVAAAMRDPRWLTHWLPAILKEIKRVFEEFKVMDYVPYKKYLEYKMLYGDAVVLGHLVVPFKEKLDALGNFLKAASRITFSDKLPTAIETFATCADPATIRYLAQVTANLGGEHVTNDVAGAYYYGTPTPVERGGRAIFARIPPGFEQFGYPPVDPVTGERMIFHITGNLPGIRDAGVIWDREYTGFLLSEGFTQSVVDRRVFFKFSPDAPDKGAKPLPGGGSIIVVGVVVDDSWFTSTNSKLLKDFMGRWSSRFKSSVDANPSLKSDFAGIHFETTVDNAGRKTTTLSCDKSIDNLEKRMESYPPHANSVTSTPMAADGLGLLYAEPSDDNPLLGPEKVSEARQLLGMCGWITGSVRADAHFTYVALSQRIGHHLTRNVWNALLRLCHYLVNTRDKVITYNPSPATSSWRADVDSSLINAPGGGSFGGYTLYFPGSGPFVWNCTVPRKLTDSSGGAELVMSTMAVKAILGWRILMRELRLGNGKPTELRMDATAALLGTAREKVAKNMRYLAVRYAMVRDAVNAGEIVLSKVSTSANRADALTKPVPLAMRRHYDTLMGTEHEEQA